MMIIDNKFEMSSSIYLKTCKEQSERIITGILVNPIGITYRVSFGSTESWHYEIELSSEKNILAATTN